MTCRLSEVRWNKNKASLSSPETVQIIIFLTLGIHDPEGGKNKLIKNENSNGHLPGGCQPKNSPATKKSWIAEQLLLLLLLLLVKATAYD